MIGVKKWGFFLVVILAAGCMLACAEDVSIEFIGKDDSRFKKVDPSVEELAIMFVTETDVKGLEQLSNLKTLMLDFWSEYTDFSFLADVPTVERLSISSCYIENLSFIKHLPNLMQLVIFDSKIRDAEVLDLSNNSVIEYIDIDASGLNQVPNIPFIPTSLQYLLLVGNDIEELSELNIQQLKSIPYVSLEDNPIDDLPKEFILEEDIPDEYSDFFGYDPGNVIIFRDRAP